MSSWSCPYEAEGICRRVDGAYCRPGMRGCVLVGKVKFADGLVPAPRWPSEPPAAAAEAPSASRDEQRGPGLVDPGDPLGRRPGAA